MSSKQFKLRKAIAVIELQIRTLKAVSGAIGIQGFARDFAIYNIHAHYLAQLSAIHAQSFYDNAKGASLSKVEPFTGGSVPDIVVVDDLHA